MQPTNYTPSISPQQTTLGPQTFQTAQKLLKNELVKSHLLKYPRNYLEKIAKQTTHFLTQFPQKENREIVYCIQAQFSNIRQIRIDIKKSHQRAFVIQYIALDVILGQGQYKTIHPSYSIYLNLMEEKVIGKESILARTWSKFPPNIPNSAIYRVISGIETERAIYQEGKPPFSWPKVKKVFYQNGLFFLESEREWFPYVLDNYLFEVNPTLPTEKKIILFIQLAEILKKWHRNKLTHNDVKPNNVFIKKNGEIYLGDCDLFQKIRHNVRQKRVNFPYWSTARKNGYVLPESDVHGAISTMMTMLFGHSFIPFSNNPIILMMEKNRKILFQQKISNQSDKNLSAVQRDIFQLYMTSVEKGLLLNDWLIKNPYLTEKINRHDKKTLMEIEERSITADDLVKQLKIIQKSIT